MTLLPLVTYFKCEYIRVTVFLAVVAREGLKLFLSSGKCTLHDRNQFDFNGKIYRALLLHKRSRGVKQRLCLKYIECSDSFYTYDEEKQSSGRGERDNYIHPH